MAVGAIKKAPTFGSAFCSSLPAGRLALGLEPNRTLKKYPVDIFSEGVGRRVDLGEIKNKKSTYFRRCFLLLLLGSNQGPSD